MTNSNDSHSTTPEAEASTDDIDFRRYVRLILSHMWMILAIFAVVVTATVLYTLRQPRIYQATGSMIIDPRPPQVLGAQVQEVIQLGTGNYWWNQEYYNTQVDILQSKLLMRMTVLAHNLHENEKLVGKFTNERTEADRIEQAIGALMGSIRVARPEKKRTVEVSARHRDPELAAEITNAHVETYIDYNLDLRIDGTNVAMKWLSDELDLSESKLRETELELSNFLRTNDILSVSLEDRQNLLAANIQRYTTAYNDAHIQVIELGATRKRLKELANLSALESPIFSMLNNQTGEDLKKQYYEERRGLLELQTEFGEKHPEYTAQKKKTDEVLAAIEGEASTISKAVDQKYKAAVAREAAFRAEVEKYRQEAFKLGPIKVDHNRLVRQEKNDEQRFGMVLGRLRSTDLASRLKSVNVRRLDKARVPTSPVSPSMRRNLLTAVMLSLFLGIGMAFLLDYLDRTVKTSEDVESTVGAPVLGIIPVVAESHTEANAPSNATDLYVFKQPSSTVAECCRAIRTNLLFMAADKAFKTLVVTSPNPREGKTTSVLYLGTIMAQSGQKVLLVDSDLRRPRLHQSVGVSRTKGLSNLILGDITADEAIKTTDIPNLFLLPCGPTPPNPAELLMTQRFRDSLAELATKYDRILLDSPPILAVTDATVLSREVDGTILVMRAGATTRDAATRAGRQLADVNARVAGVVLNGLDLQDRSNGYYTQYYTYGYSPTEPREANSSAT